MLLNNIEKLLESNFVKNANNVTGDFAVRVN